MREWYDMKTRIISAAAGLVILAVVFFFFDTIFYNIAVTAVTMIAVYEVLLATKYIENKVLAALCLMFAGFVPSLRYTLNSFVGPAVCLSFAAALFILLLVEHRTLRIEQVGLSFFVSLVIPLSFSMLIVFRDNYETQTGLFYILLSLGTAWFSDAGAYFVGRACGKRKLAPEISPKKTVEGAVGGVISDMIFCSLYTWIFMSVADLPMDISWLRLLIFVPLGAVFGILGDLSASIIKRQCSVKDFGNIMPGHGGVLDRFDSWLFVAPLLYSFVQVFPIVK